MKQSPKHRIPLEQLAIRQPCPADYAAMRREGDAARFCLHCQKHVHDICRLTLSEAQQLICDSAGAGVCVRLARDAAGTIITLDYPSPPQPPQRRFWRPASGALAFAGAVASAFFASWTIGRPLPQPPAGITVAPQVPAGSRVEMGDLAPATQPTTQPTVKMGEVVVSPVAEPNPTLIMGKIALPTTNPAARD